MHVSLNIIVLEELLTDACSKIVFPNNKSAVRFEYGTAPSFLTELQSLLAKQKNKKHNEMYDNFANSAVSCSDTFHKIVNSKTETVWCEKVKWNLLLNRARRKTKFGYCHLVIEM